MVSLKIFRDCMNGEWDGTALQRSAVHLGVMLASLGVRLVCLGVILIIIVSCSLEAHVPTPTLVSSSHLPSFLSPYVSLPTVAGATGITYPLSLRNSFKFLCNNIRNSFRFLCNKFKKLQHYCNVLFIYQ